MRRRVLAILLLFMAAGLHLLRRSSASAGQPDAPIPGPGISHGYDVRTGAAAYAPIIGGIGGMVVAAVLLVFEIVSSHPGPTPELLERATGLLVLGLLSCIVGAFAFAAIGAERQLTADLPAASLYAGAATSIGVVAIMAAFEALAALYLPHTKSLFALITIGAAIAAAVLVSLVLGDAWLSAPGGHWLASQKAGIYWGTFASGVSALSLVAAAVLYFSGVRIGISDEVTKWFVGAGVVLALASGLGSMFRTMHGEGAREAAIAKGEAIAVLGCLVAYLLVLLLCMP